MRKELWKLAAAGLLTVLTAVPAAADWWPITEYSYSSNPLEYSNGQKVVTGRYNILHAVYQDLGAIKYMNSTDGLSWSPPVVLFCGTPGRHPAIAVDTYGKIGVVWEDVTSGALYYAYHDGTAWSLPTPIAAQGAEPSIAARGHDVYVAWTTTSSVRYASFPTLVPVLQTGEVLDSTLCGATHFRFPSIALVNDPCKPAIPLVGYLYDSDEQASGGACQSPATVIGPKVTQRNNTLNSWSLAWSDLRTSGVANSTVAPVSLSLSSRFSTGDLYVGYSDVQNNVARTLVGHGKGATWSAPATVDAQSRHIHVRASELTSSPAGAFRLALSEISSYDANYRDGLWTGSGALSWTTSTQWVSGPPATRPHGNWWKRCASGTQTDFKVLAEEDLAVCECGGPSLGVEYTQGACASGSPPVLTAYPCKFRLSTAVLGPHGPVVVEGDEVGAVKSLSDRGATIVTAKGETIDVTWRAGRLAYAWDTGFALNGATEADVVFTSKTVAFSVDHDGVVGGFDRGPGVCVK